ncbi:MAG TPA: NAD(P)H-hydrate dehydratase [Actinomycetota bacterium]|nr:NAD(P)H-hydrate dehydratase [Actinomycetota bacterium]
MRPLVTPDEMARADARAIESGTPAEVLMERAGAAVARAARQAAGGRYGRRAVVVAGTGNNGGDGFVAARRLLAEGVAVRCLVVGDAGSARGAAAHHLERLRRAGGRVEPWRAARARGADVAVDAVFGTGFRGAAEGVAAEAIDALCADGAPVVAVDVPSGVAGATGAVVGPAVRAHVTVAMGAEKLGTALSPGSVLAGRVEVVDIGIDVAPGLVSCPEPDDVSALLPPRAPLAHKRSSGAIALLAGSDGMSGAAVLAARGALRAGVGYVTVGATPRVAAVVAAAVPEAVTARASDRGALGPDALAALGDVVERATAVAIGPGLGRGDGQRALVERALATVAAPVVVDADGLNVLSGDPDALRRRADARRATILTPHPAELARLLGRATGDVVADRLGCARAAAERFACVVLLKGHRTLVAAPDGRVVVVPVGGPELATAGTGDVLTGVVAALVAAGSDPFDAAWAGAYLHGVAGARAARGATSGVLAGDVADALAPARAALERGDATDTRLRAAAGPRARFTLDA